MDDDAKISDIERKIEREKALINAANAMRQQTNNDDVRSKLDTQMRDGRRNLEFFEQKLRQLRMQKLGQGVDNMSLGGSTLASRPRSADMRNDAYGPPTPPPKDASGYSQGQYGDMASAQSTFSGQSLDLSAPKARPNFTKLGAYLTTRR